ncbi:MAG: hypothetical protein A3B74_05425 [Candidatus Kerfeldbacteria bacterium RIFCSPHIGHO2_02_FULL_42_14]|uniref:Metallophosphoesterase n=1 Tax=Candidatus Kerfeldbacteria bacterium RIFCSPHIGHO2_02_FULL_42_14 TaxID=1798540 RepID=A0A1G2AU91_9BACT|nr:MAG: hypothetical protein A3B74_05425 [Candidatus Kerfeldbacteria bacterium RIFCSPHIGHO2_02_FULL_42_14]OGY81627.1 MAG: hypothetical protein A3E60_01815 [Candidatus Kerfeldbacteria bacterium RIFCSPHIGHO2_12_FULL_42_13]OGY83251.1 MAG: hypothetical protein A3I91_03225 [Candidatus Kerfeldbacteria bacterium RIFCSPLOWO2_02_FULL_42_19]OGY86284.1 MAG: hypothetical protein A3G01_00390 [Candidatus Kerfeldbacteria bacterium RIFCSPLOWO2_12_FULL_43_9]
MNILIFGDIFGKPGRRGLQAWLPELRKETHADLVIANAENLAHGMGVTQTTLQECLDAGVDIFTGGNDMWTKPEVEMLLASQSQRLLRPANYPPDTPGSGYIVLEVGTKKIFIISLLGRVFMQPHLDCPFRTADNLLKKYHAQFTAILVDIHAEATSEKVALGHYLDGRVTLVYGTHTHVPTADMRILPQGTAYCTDVGFSGPKNSVIGVDTNVILTKFLTQRPKAHTIPESGVVEMNCLHLVCDRDTGKALRLTRLYREITF